MDTKPRGPDFDERMMRRALELAARGRGQVSPSPLVGCVIVSAEGEAVGEGFYLYEGVKHAETLALERAAERTAGGTAYVSLEPHAHHGRTPPCTDALLRARVRRVVAPVEDPNPLVSGQGFRHLRDAGVEVEVGLLADEATKLNEKYIHYLQSQGLPFVHLKMACSLDGRIATRTGDARWITGSEARARAHELRHEYDAILVGANTVACDDPALTDRSDLPRHRPLTRVVLDQHLRALTAQSRLARTAREAPVIVFTSKAADAAKASQLEACGVSVIRDSAVRQDARATLAHLGRRSIQSVLIEGGGQVAAHFLAAGLVNKVTFFIAPMIIGGTNAVPAVAGLGAANISDATHLRDTEITLRGSDIEITGYPKVRMKAEG
ncbi:MAG: bifunctional diaminohydroxyphosphoribosylaminopyrimidine deaminase/5-amino-6-(5-phosphoribosylamino)uracil reductase RibD [Pyrinomonadaceae bacterium]